MAMRKSTESMADAAWAQPVEIARVASYTEGPVFDRDGNLYFSHGDSISRLSPDGELSIWAKLDGPNGHKVLPDGNHLVCEPKRSQVLLLDANGNIIRVASSECDGKPLRAPNDFDKQRPTNISNAPPTSARKPDNPNGSSFKIE